MLVRIRKKGNPPTLLEMQAGAATLENSVEFPQQLKIELPYDPAIALLGICPKDTKKVIQRGICTPMFMTVISTIAILWRERKCPSTG